MREREETVTARGFWNGLVRAVLIGAIVGAALARAGAEEPKKPQEMKYVGALYRGADAYYWGPAPCVDLLQQALNIALTQIPARREPGELHGNPVVVDRAAQLDDAVCRAEECTRAEQEIRPQGQETELAK